MGPAEVLLGVEAAGEDLLGRQPRLDAGLAGVVDDRHRGAVHDAPARLAHPQAEVGLIGVEEEALVHEAGAEQGLAAGEHEGADGPVALALVLVLAGVEDPLADPRGPSRQALGGRAPRPRARAALGKRRMVGNSSPSPVSCRTPSRPTSGRPSSSSTRSAKVPLDDLGVGVEEEHVARHGRHQRAVVRVRESRGSRSAPLAPAGSARSTSSEMPSLRVVVDDRRRRARASPGSRRRCSGSARASAPRWSRR